MKHIKHAYFGELNTEELDGYDVLWEENIPYKNGNIIVFFWFCGKDDLSLERLDSFEKFLKDFDVIDEKSRKALKAYLEEEPEYLNFHAEELENIPENIDDFVTEMQIKTIGLWYSIYEGSIGEVIIDYMIRLEETDEILAVKYDLNEEILAIDWES